MDEKQENFSYLVLVVILVSWLGFTLKGDTERHIRNTTPPTELIVGRLGKR